MLSIHLFFGSGVAHSHGVAQTTSEAGGDRRLCSTLLAAISPQHWTLPSADDEGPRYVVSDNEVASDVSIDTSDK